MEFTVVKRSGETESVKFDKITRRVKLLAKDLDRRYVDPIRVAQKVINGLYDGITTKEIDTLAAETAAGMNLDHPDYGLLAGRIALSGLHKETPSTFSQAMNMLYDNVDVHGVRAPIVDSAFIAIVNKHTETLDMLIDSTKDMTFDYLAWKTMEKSYLLKVGDKIIERPQYMWLRVAVGLHGDNLSAVGETYKLLSDGYFTHATPTLFNSGTPKPQLSSCFLVATEDDSVEGIFNTVKDIANISKWAGGIGLHVHNVRAAGSRIRGTNGLSDGLIPMLRVINETANYIDQGGKRKGSFSIYLEPWHSDILAFLNMRRPVGDEKLRCPDLFPALWIPNLFMERVYKAYKTNELVLWSLFCPDEAPGLSDCYGKDFEDLYTKYEEQGRYKEQIDIKKVWSAILTSQIESGLPYMLYKDHANEKSNQKNLGVIKSSNLCIAGETRVELNICDMVSISKLHEDGTQLQVMSASPQTFDRQVTKQESDGKIVTSNQNVTFFQQTSESKSARTIFNGVKKVVTVHLDNGTQFRCTPDHKIATFKGDWVEASKLKRGTRLASPTYSSKASSLREIREAYAASYKYAPKVSKVEDLGEETEVYDLQVQDTSCFYIVPINPKTNKASEPILVHNCTEIMEYSDDKETAVCNLASLALPKYVKGRKFDFQKLEEVTRVIVRNLNKVIDINYYPTDKTKLSNLKHRPIGIGVQGLADTFAKLGYSFGDKASRELNINIFETIYFAALDESCSLAETHGYYESFNNSPTNSGVLQFDMWGVEQSKRYNWDALRERIKKFGLRNSLLTTVMPTASTASILNNCEAIEPFKSNVYARQLLSGTFTVVNRHLVEELIDIDKWDDEMRNSIIEQNGSIQHRLDLPENLRERYRTIFEIPGETLIEMSADRGPYICQSQSLNLFTSQPNLNQLTKWQLLAWKRGLKTGMYYLRMTPPSSRSKVINVVESSQKMLTESATITTTKQPEIVEGAVCTMEEGCITCSS